MNSTIWFTPRFTRCARAAVAAAAITGAAAHAQTWPQATIRLVVPWAPGGTTDMIARAIGQPLAQSLKQPVVVDNKPGAGGNIGTAQAVKAKPDGYTLILVTSTTQAINPHLYQKPGFDPKKDFTPIIYLGAVPNVLVVSAKSPFKSVQDVLDQARKEPGKLNRLLKDPAVVNRLQEIGAEIGGGTPQDLEAFAESELRRYGEVVRDGGIKVD